jgi:hypothetical protein
MIRDLGDNLPCFTSVTSHPNMLKLLRVVTGHRPDRWELNKQNKQVGQAAITLCFQLQSTQLSSLFMGNMLGNADHVCAAAAAAAAAVSVMQCVPCV